MLLSNIQPSASVAMKSNQVGYAQKKSVPGHVQETAASSVVDHGVRMSTKQVSKAIYTSEPSLLNIDVYRY